MRILLLVVFITLCLDAGAQGLLEPVDDSTALRCGLYPGECLPEHLMHEGANMLPVAPEIVKEFLYDQYTLDDNYMYGERQRSFQWEQIRWKLFDLDVMQKELTGWGVLQNRHGVNGSPPLSRLYRKSAHNNLEDNYGVERYRGTPLYLPHDTITPERYGRDGSLVKMISDTTSFYKVRVADFAGEWLIPKRYVKLMDTVAFEKVVFVDRKNQNITVMEKGEGRWLVRSMNPATTGLHKPPYQHETPLGIFVLQEKKPKMIYLEDGTSRVGGFAPWASRFSNGGYIHGVPVNSPRKEAIEYSWSLGTTPRSHMCVRNATSHAKFVFDWAEIFSMLVFVIE